MQLTQAMAGLEAAVDAQLRVAGPEAAELGAQIMTALQPAIQQSFMDVLCMAATEISSQISGSRVDVRIVDGDPEFVVTTENVESTPPPTDVDDAEARITLRLPGYLKDIIADAASATGDSVNAFVVDALKNQAHTVKTSGRTRVRSTIEL